jgi:hypothetical protein
LFILHSQKLWQLFKMVKLSNWKG